MDNTTSANLWSRMVTVAEKKRRKVGIGIDKVTPRIIESLKKAEKYVDVFVVGKKIEGFDGVESDTLEPLVQAAKDKAIDALVRGNFDALDAYNALHKILRIGNKISEIAFFKLNGIRMIDDAATGVFCLTPLSFVNERTLDDKMKSINLHVDFFNKMGLTPKLGILGPGKPADRADNIPEVTQGLDDAEFLVDSYTKKGIWIKYFNHQIEYAVQEANIVVAQNSWSGNLASHCLLYLGNVDFLGSAALNIEEIVYVDDSEAMQDFTNCLIFGAFLANSK